VAKQWYQDFRNAFTDAGGKLDANGDLPEPAFSGLVEILGDDPTVDLVHAVEVDGSEGFLFVQGDNAYVARFAPPEPATVTFFGDLNSGRYTEQVDRQEKESVYEMQFEHDRLGGGRAIHAGFSRPYRTPGMWLSDKSEREIARGDQLRALFRRWSAPLASPSEDAT
jgi:hypothetical protein